MRISDWNSDVCSSDLASRGSPRLPHLGYATTMIPMLLTLLALAAQPAAAEQPATPAAPDPRPYVALVTDLGTITLRIEDRRAPVTAKNFLRYSEPSGMDSLEKRRVGTGGGERVVPVVRR